MEYISTCEGIYSSPKILSKDIETADDCKVYESDSPLTSDDSSSEINSNGRSCSGDSLQAAKNHVAGEDGRKGLFVRFTNIF